METTIIKQCKQCSDSFEARLAEHRRGGAVFCSLSCAATHTNNNRPYLEHACKSCEKTFKSKSNHAKYCSKACKDLSTEKTLPKHRYHLSAIIRKKYGLLPCFSCGWDKAVCDLHHVIPRTKGGRDIESNLVLLCPNCHRLVHNKLIDVFSLPTISSKCRTMSSSEHNSEPEALAGN